MSTNTEFVRVAGPIECQPWCEDHDGHVNELCTADQVCFSDERWISLSESGVDINADGVTRDAIGLYLSTTNGTPTLTIDPDSVSDGMRLTADELDTFIENMTELRAVLRAEQA